MQNSEKPDLLTRQTKLIESIKSVVPAVNPFLYWTDSYKVSHIQFETEGVQEIFSNMTIRFDHYIKDMLGDAYDGKAVVFGLQWMMLRLHVMAQEGFFKRPKEEVISEMKAVHGSYISNEKFDHFEALHDLGYLPIVVKSLDEGTLAPIGTPVFTIRNTIAGFEWLPNFLETGMSTDLWKQLTVATVGRAYRMVANEYALETTGSTAGTEWQNHDFHVRGASGFESAAINGVGFLLSSCGTDNLPALWAADKFYQSTNADGLLAGSVAAGEHSVTTSGILTEVVRAELNGLKIDNVEAEKLYVSKLLTERFPSGIFSYVADSFDFWSFVTKVLPEVKDAIMQREGKFVVRGDSGDPVEIICGTHATMLPRYKTEEDAVKALTREAEDDFQFAAQESKWWGDEEYLVYVESEKAYKMFNFTADLSDCGETYENIKFVGSDVIEFKPQSKGTIEILWEIFGGTVNEQGYKVLDPHIGMIYGDGITPQRQKQILQRLKAKGFASTNIVFGVGSYSLNMLSRDHLGIAVKATNQIVEIAEGVVLDQPIYKDPKTDSSKKSARGLLSVHEENGTLVTKDMQTRKQENTGLLNTLYMNGQFHKLTTVFEIRDKIWK